jgi:hypothetical protein
MRHPSTTRTAFVLGLVGVGLLMAACSSSSKTSTSSTAESTPSGPALSLLYTVDGEGLVLHDARTDTSRTLVPGASHDGRQAASASGRYLAFSYTAADSTHLALLDL